MKDGLETNEVTINVEILSNYSESDRESEVEE